MQPLRTRLICRADNRFTPSIALWQHFIAPNQSFLHQLRLSSSAAKAAYDGADKDGSLPNVQQSSEFEHSEADIARERGRVPSYTIRKLETSKGTWRRNKVDASIAKNVQEQYDRRLVSLTEPERLLASARAAFEVAEDYEGLVVEPMVHPKPIKESQMPWCLKQEGRAMSGMDRYIEALGRISMCRLTLVIRLAIELDRFYEFAKPSRFENIARKHIVEQVRNHVREALPDHVLEVFGSERSGLALATSDIDFRLMRQSQIVDPSQAKLPPTKRERMLGIRDLHSLHWDLKDQDAYLLPVVRYARYPLISLQDRRSGLDIQIVLSNDTSLSRNIMQGYMEQYTYLRKLYYVVKTILDIRGLSDVFRGGFGSYSLFMMIVASLRHNPPPRKDAAGGLLSFLKFWQDFDTEKHGILIEPVSLFDKTSDAVTTNAVKRKLEVCNSILFTVFSC